MLCCDKNIEVKSSDYVCFLLEQAHTPTDLKGGVGGGAGTRRAICQAEVVAASSSFPTNSVRSEPHPSPGLSYEHRLPSAAAVYRCSPHPRWRGRALSCRRCAFRNLKSKTLPGNKQSLGLPQKGNFKRLRALRTGLSAPNANFRLIGFAFETTRSAELGGSRFSSRPT